MIPTLYLQAEIAVMLFLIIIVLIIIIPIVIWKSRKTSRPERDDVALKWVMEQIADMKENTPGSTDIDEMQKRLEILRGFVIRSADESNLSSLERLEDITTELKKEAQENVAQYAKQLISDSTVTREEFTDMERKLDKFVVDDTKPKRIKFLAELFDSKKQSTINWKCSLIKLLRNGIAPDIDAVKFAQESIPSGSALQSFLKKLVGAGIAKKDQIDSFSVNDEFEWMYSYIEKPALLLEEFEKRDVLVKKEKEYQKWLKDNLEKVEPGLKKEGREIDMPTGTIDFLCRDVNAKPVGLELKYPAATTSNAKQLIGYADDFRKRADGENFRGIMVAPKIPDGLQNLLSQHDLEYREIPFGDESEKAETTVTGEDGEEDAIDKWSKSKNALG